MDWIDALILGALQGVTEFLPISSSGHLVLGEHFLGLKIEVLKSFDVIVHMATLLAILIYFWRDVWGMIKGFFMLIGGKAKFNDPYSKLIFYIIIGTIPAVFLGLFAEDWIDTNFRNVEAVGIFMFIVGIIFILGEFTYKRFHEESSVKEKFLDKVDEARDCIEPGGYESTEIRGLTWWKAIIIGVAQSIALVPGVSRSGSTIVAGLFQGIKRSQAARFSFLLGIPAIAGAGLLTAIKMGGDGSQVDILPMIIGFVASFLFGLFSVWFLMQFLKKHSLIVFSVYLIALGLGTFL
ncbi:undecaprenyl-diphosphate phosphatase [Patescibacteria group bacterium]